ncbi:hypothetical protein MNBD_GAMMA22-2348 [hydrothermal vent metagenome]|uniref:Restriction endonuclease n=1 Tax=hydrothermal vent metagenome TaxID=652676 RepID=A0A3B0ZVJ5_9ZZZZ
MTIKEYEKLIREQITNVIKTIIAKNKTLNISAKSRAGAEISNWLEAAFVKATQSHKYLIDSEAAPKGNTKNPWDARCYFKLNEHKEDIWIDFKAFKLSAIDSNPDIGTPNKVIKFIEEGGFYLLYVHVYYEEYNNGLKFISSNNEMVKSYFLKDISDTFRRTPTNQLQVNISVKPTYRTREEFIELLMKKINEGLIRQLEKA